MEYAPYALAAGALYFVVKQRSHTGVSYTQRDADFHPHPYRERPPPALLKDRIVEPTWGQKLHRPVKAVPSSGGLVQYLFTDHETGQVRLAFQNAGFQSL